MREIRLGLKHGLSADQVSLYADRKFMPEQMRMIRIGLESGLSIEQVSSYASPNITSDEMFKIMERIRKRNFRNLK